MGGTQKRTSKKFNVDSMPIGKCNAGQAINKCTGGGNAWGKFNHRGGWCSKGKNIGVQVTCKAKPKPTPKKALVRAQNGKKIKAGQAFYPEVLYNGKYYPICGHYFWDNHEGAKIICKSVGMKGGKQKRTSKKFNKDSMPIGKCNAGQALDKCTGGGNAWGKFNHRGGWCSKGKNIGVQVTCSK